jgi:arylsulfatase A-like enzyme
MPSLRCLLFLLAALAGPGSAARAADPGPSAAAGSPHGSPGNAFRQRAKNLLFIVSDDLNTMLGCYGDPLAKTPHIDALARRGTTFERAYCTFPLCGPSRNSILTGLYPNATGIFANQQIFRQTIPEHPSLPELFRREGGFAIRVGKLFHYNVPMSIGTTGHDDPASWEATFNPAGVDRLEEEPRIFTLLPGQYGGTLSWYASPAADERHTDGILARQAEQVLQLCAADRSRPFLLALGFFRPHTPFVAPAKPYFEMHPLEEMPVVTGVAEDQADLPAAALGSRKVENDRLTDDLRRECRQAYNASISFMDAQVGRVVAALDRLGLADDTVIVFTSDHGYHMGEHGLWQKLSLFEESCRVPLLVVAPGVAPPGSRAASPVSQVDLYPTLAVLCGLDAPESLQGQSLVPMLRDPATLGRGWAVSQVVRGGGKNRPTVTPDISSEVPRYVGYSLRTPRWRYTEWDEGRQGRELYDHDADPRELTNLAADPNRAADVAALARQLADAVSQTLPPGGTPPPLRHDAWPPTLQAR